MVISYLCEKRDIGSISEGQYISKDQGKSSPTYAESSIDSLSVLCGVPTGVVDDDSIRSGESDPWDIGQGDVMM